MVRILNRPYQTTNEMSRLCNRLLHNFAARKSALPTRITPDNQVSHPRRHSILE